MSNEKNIEEESSLILAAEECPPEKFKDYHSFSTHDESIIRKLSAHGPVLLRGGRGSGKSALLIEAYMRMQKLEKVFPIYMSLRYLPLLQSDGQEYITHFCTLLSNNIQKELKDRSKNIDFGSSDTQTDLQVGLKNLAQKLESRIVLLFDDAAHIGREKPLEVFFDLFRTLSSNLVSCKSSIYPGVTKFGIRFDVFNDSTVIDIGRSDVASFPEFFPEVVSSRYPRLSKRSIFSDRLTPQLFANLLGRAVVGNLRGFILACNFFESKEKVGVPEITECLLEMASDYYWPLMEEVAPKLGVYESLIEPSREIIEATVEQATRQVKETTKKTPHDRVLIHRQLVANYIKIFEILEYLGFVSKREASRALKSGGRGPVYAINLCNLLDSTPGRRLTQETIEEWLSGNAEPAEIHVSGSTYSSITLPELQEEHGLAILDKDISVLKKSKAYPYGLNEPIIDRIRNAGISTVAQLANTSDEKLDAIDYIGSNRIKQIRAVMFQAIWM